MGGMGGRRTDNQGAQRDPPLGKEQGLGKKGRWERGQSPTQCPSGWWEGGRLFFVLLCSLQLSIMSALIL